MTVDHSEITSDEGEITQNEGNMSVRTDPARESTFSPLGRRVRTAKLATSAATPHSLQYNNLPDVY
jgi:hypothetical protein